MAQPLVSDPPTSPKSTSLLHMALLDSLQPAKRKDSNPFLALTVISPPLACLAPPILFGTVNPVFTSSNSPSFHQHHTQITLTSQLPIIWLLSISSISLKCFLKCLWHFSTVPSQSPLPVCILSFLAVKYKDSRCAQVSLFSIYTPLYAHSYPSGVWLQGERPSAGITSHKCICSNYWGLWETRLYFKVTKRAFGFQEEPPEKENISAKYRNGSHKWAFFSFPVLWDCGSRHSMPRKPFLDKNQSCHPCLSLVTLRPAYWGTLVQDRMQNIFSSHFQLIHTFLSFMKASSKTVAWF